MPKILVADDNSNILKMVTSALKDQGIEVVGVGHGEAAVRKLPDVKPDVILADVFMPVRNGFEVCEFVKNDSRFAHIPVVLLVGAFDPVDMHEVKRVKADGLLNKPFAPVEKLLEMVQAMLAKSAGAAAPAATQATGETVELTAEEMKKLTHAAPEMSLPAAEPEPEQVASGPKRLEFDSGEQPVTFGEFGAPVTEIRPADEEEEEDEDEDEEEEEEEEAAPLLGESSYASSGFDTAETVDVESKPEPPASRSEPSGAVEPEPPTPQYGGIEVPMKEPSPDEPPIPVSFSSSSEELEIVRDEAMAAAPSYANAAPPPELALTPQEYMESSPPPAAPVITKSHFDDTAIMPPISQEELAAAARRAEERARAAREAEAAAAVAHSPVLEEMGLVPPAPEPAAPVVEVSDRQVSNFGVPAMSEFGAPPAVAGAASLGYSALTSPPAEESRLPEPEPPPPPPPPSWTPSPAAQADTSTMVVPSAAPEKLRPMFTGNTDALARPRVDEALVDAVADRVIEKMQGGMMNKLTKDILRPIIEALIAQELDKRP